MNALSKKYREREIGQSLAEVAIFLPVIIILILGVVEVSNLLVTQNRVSAASRAATGFAATNITGDEWADENRWSASMVDVARNNVTETLELDENRWDIWTIKATVNGAGDGFDEWRAVHAYGENAVMTDQEWDSVDVQSDILAALGESGINEAKDLEVAATVAYHDRHSLLGLDAFNVGALTRVRGLNVMRVDPEPSYYSCDVFPISIYFNNISLYPHDFEGKMVDGGELFDPTIWEYPKPGTYNYPYNNDIYPHAAGGHPLLDAVRGDIFVAREMQAPTIGAFGWLTWDATPKADGLRESLTYPGNLSVFMPPPAGKVNYDNPYDPFMNSTDPEKKDLVPNVGDWVQGSTGNMANVDDLLQGYVQNQRPVQIVVFDEVSDKNGANFNYKIAGFVIVKIVGYQTGGSGKGSNEKQIMIEFVDWGDACNGLEDME